MVDRNIDSARVPRAHLDALRLQSAASQAAMQERAIGVEASEEGMQQWIDEGAFNILAMARRFNTLDERVKRRTKEEESQKLDKKEETILEIEKIEEISDQYSQRNPELQTKTLLYLRERIKTGDSPEEILRKVLETYSDFSLADEALEFLLETTSGELAASVKAARDELNRRFGREIRAGKNIGAQARSFSQEGLGSPTALRDMYREITGNPRDPHLLFDELNQKFTYEKMKVVIDFLLHSLGSDLKSKGPSISRGELQRLLTEARTLQAILGVYRFFKSRTPLITSSFARQELELPQEIDFEALAKIFMKIVQERYPSSDKLRQVAIQGGMPEDLIAQLILLTQLRDAVRQVAPRLFKSEQHRQDILMTAIEAIEEVDDALEDKEE